MTAAVAHTPSGPPVDGAGPRRAPVVEHRAGRDRDRVRGVGQWPPERTAAVRLVRARQNVDRAAALGDPRAQELARRHIDVVEADARTCLSRPAPVGAGADEQAAAERARAGLARMLDPDPVTRAAGTDDLTRAWPAEHLELLRGWAEHQQRHSDPATDDAAINAVADAVDGDAIDGDAIDGDAIEVGAASQDDAVAQARAAVAAIGSAELDDDSDSGTVPSGSYPPADADADDSVAGDVEGWSR